MMRAGRNEQSVTCCHCVSKNGLQPNACRECRHANLLLDHMIQDVRKQGLPAAKKNVICPDLITCKSSRQTYALA